MELEGNYQAENFTDKTIDLNEVEEEVHVVKKVLKISEIQKEKKSELPEKKSLPDKGMTPEKKKNYSEMFKPSKPTNTTKQDESINKRESVSPAPKARFIPNKNKGSTPKRELTIKGSGNLVIYL